MRSPFFSVVIPVYNKVGVIGRTIQSVFNCREQSIEVVVVDDGSTDGSQEIIREIAAQDPRVHAVFHDNNRSVYQARKTGVAATTGDYVLFLDGDDELLPGALDVLGELMRNKPVDILHFGMKLETDAQADEEKARHHEQWLMPYHGVLEGHEVLDSCLIDTRYCWNLCGKVFEGTLCRQAFAHCTDRLFLRAEDQVAYFMCAYLAKSYRGAPSKRLYLYHYGSGTDGRENMPHETFVRYWGTYPCLLDEFKQFLDGEGADDQLKDLYLQRFRQLLLMDMGAGFSALVDPADRAKALDTFMETWEPRVAAAQIANSSWFDLKKVAIEGADAQLFAPIAPKLQNIALYYSSIRTQREAELVYALASLWRDRGANVGIIVDEPVDNQFAALFDDFIVTAIQPRFPLSEGNLTPRFDALSFIVERDSLDTIIYGQWASHVLIWDLLLLKGLGVSTIVHFSDRFGRPLVNPRTYFAWQPYSWVLADGATFDRAPTVVCAAPKVTLQALALTRAWAMIFRDNEKAIPAPAANATIALASQV